MASSVTLTSTSLEGQLLEVIKQIQVYQSSTTTNPNTRNIITTPLIMNTSTGLATVTLSIPITTEIDTDGSIDSTATEVYLNP